MITTEAQREKALLVGLDLTGAAKLDLDDRLAELHVLAESAGAQVMGQISQARKETDPATLIGKGKLQEVSAEAASIEADVVLFDRDLSPSQLRNLERELPCRVIDRTQLILDIFARRARTREGQLQVELAQLNYLLPRLAGRGVEMSRLGGGIGTRGPGETKLETDRRRIYQRVRKLEQQIESVRSHRGVQRQQRQAVPLPTVALAGYTNAGKSTLFNRLTGAAVTADARMFATLDPTVRHIVLPSHRRALLSDTVGFIRDLPPPLMKAFRATFEEVSEAALILHLVDISAPNAAELAANVTRVIGEIGAGATPQLIICTKADLLPPDEPADDAARRIVLDAGIAPAGTTDPIVVSARTGEGLDRLLALVDESLHVDRLSRVRLRLPGGDGATLHLLHEYGRVIEEKWEADACWVDAEIPESLLRRVERFVIPGAAELL